MTIDVGDGPRIVGFRIEQPGVIGEYYPESLLDLSEFTSSFQKDYGVDPIVVAVIVEADGQKATLDETQKDLQEAKLPGVTVPTVSGVASQERIEEARARARAARPMSSETSRTATSSTSWAPGYSEVWAAQPMSGQSKISTYNSWYDGGSDSRKPTNLPTDWGIEFDVTQYNPDIRNGPVQAGPARNNCIPANTYRNDFWAARTSSKSAPFSGWTVEYVALSQSVDPAAIGAYADGDDTFDECQMQSMAIGIGFPRSIPDVDGFYDIVTNIYTDRGTQGTSRVLGTIQAISNDCNNVGSSPASWCMGLNTSRVLDGQEMSQSILALSRNWTLPKCWSVNNPEAPYAFPCSTIID